MPLKSVLKKSNLPNVARLKGEEEITAFAGDIRKAYTDCLQSLMAEHRAGASGLDVSKACSVSVETIVKHIFDAVSNLLGSKLRSTPAVIAIGGLGRRELCPKSDVDLLFLWRRNPGRAGTAFVGYMVRMLWDSGLRLSHSVHTIERLKKFIRKDMDLETAVLDARWLCGDPSLKEDLTDLVGFVRLKDGGRLLAGKLEEAKRRLKKYGYSYHILEPNVKESPGGLRDFQTIRWIGMVLPWEGVFKGLYRLSIIDRSEIEEIKNAFDFLVRTRNEMHFLMQSSWDILSLDIQNTVASGLGFRDRKDLRAIESFMKEYYSKTRNIYRALMRFIDETGEKGSLRIIEGNLYRRVGNGNLSQLNMPIRKERFLDDPLYPFKEQLKTKKRFSPSMEKRLRRLYTSGVMRGAVKERLKSSFVEFLKMPGKKSDALHDMHELGVISILFPPFEKLTCLKKYDAYHQYTADEHSIQSVHFLEDLGKRGSGLLPRLYSEVAGSIEIVLAALLHDIGKVGKGPHAVRGASMANELLKDFPISKSSRSTVTFLIKNHLVISQFGQQRNIDDRATAEEFVKRVKDHTRLKFLYLLTYADLRATGPSVWTGWKESLLENLYYKASELLVEKSFSSDYYKNVLADKEYRVLAAARDEGEKKLIKKHISIMPDHYLMMMSPSRIKAHLEMIEELGEKGFVSRIYNHPHSIEVAVCTYDRPFILSKLCGVFSVSDLNILSANAFTRDDGIVIDIFNVVDFAGKVSLLHSSREKLTGELNDVLNDRIDLYKSYLAHREKWKRRKPKMSFECSVEFENDIVTDSTIVDVSATDRPGLLFDITRIFSSEHIDIRAARITTSGGRATDSFYVRRVNGGKVSDIAMMNRLRDRICRELSRS